MNDFNIIIEYLPFFIPVILLELGLAIAALIHIFRHPNYRYGNRLVWIIVVVFLQLIGPIIYFAFGRGDQ
ncbi:MAG: PLD nuclease N-terminal domain-containing protein [Bacillota bacterium]|nr:PLD nuclease N-terminal domain-containing protein [Bacillota bacterium]